MQKSVKVVAMKPETQRISRREMLQLMGAGAVGLVMVGCAPVQPGASESGAAGETVRQSADSAQVEIWTGFGQGRMADAMSGAIERFGEESSSYTSEHIIIPWGEIHDKVLAATSAGTPPDSYRGWSWIVGDDAAIGALTPLDDFFAATGTNLDEYWVPTQAQMKFEGKLYAISISTIVNLFYYNKDRMREGGFDPDNRLPSSLWAMPRPWLGYYF